MKALVVCAVAAFVGAPAQAHAEGYVSPWAGVNFGYNSEVVRDCSGDCGQSWSWGVTAGYMGAGILGGEVEFGYAPDVYGDLVDNHVWDLMGNVIVGIPFGGTRGAGIRPYVTAGLGNVHTSITGGSVVSSLDNNDFGYNLGAGAMGYFAPHFGLRGDVRYLQTFNSDFGDHSLFIGSGQFHFWRASLGLVIR